MSTFQDLSVSIVAPDPKQPRKYYDELAMTELVASVKTHGVIQPILVRPDADGFMIVAGERRYRASLAAGLETIPATIRSLTNEQALEIQITENLLRKDVHPLEEAYGFKSLHENLSIEQISNRVGKSQGFVAKRIKLAELVEDAQTIFFRGHMDLEDAQKLCRLSPEDQDAILKECCPRDWKTKKGEWDIGNIEWIVNKKQLELKGAPFNSNDAKLYPEAGACTKCPHNSANQQLLFDDMKGSHCLKPTCFAIKTKKAEQAKLEELAANPNLICIHGYLYDNDDKAKVSTAKEMGITVLDEKMYESHYEIDPEWPEFKEWVEDNDDPEDEDYDEAEARKEYNEQKADWEKDFAEQNKAIVEGRVIKAYKIAGSGEGREELIILKSSAKSMVDQASGEGEDVSIAVKMEITNIEMREARNKELDREKLFALCVPTWTEVQSLGRLEPIEMITLIIALADSSYTVRNFLKDTLKTKDDDYRMLNIYKALANNSTIYQTVDILGMAARVFLKDRLPSKEQFDFGKYGKTAAYMAMIEKAFHNDVAEAKGILKEKTDKRIGNVAKRITALKKKTEKAKEPSIDDFVSTEGESFGSLDPEVIAGYTKSASKRKKSVPLQ